MKHLAFASLLSVLGCTSAAFAQDEPVQVKVDFSRTMGDMKPIWAWFGYDEPITRI